jgi:hypothetical protein
MIRCSTLFPLALICVALAGFADAQSVTLPTIEGENLSGHHVVLPDAASGKIAILIFGFSRASKKPTGVCADRLAADFANQSSVVIFQLPVLEDVPRFIRGSVISGMRKDVPENLRDRFVPIFHGESDLKKLVHFGEPKDAYAVLLDRDGRIIFQEHGMFDEANYAPLRVQIKSVLGQ